jgi:hypothetical protein
MRALGVVSAPETVELALTDFEDEQQQNSWQQEGSTTSFAGSFRWSFRSTNDSPIVRAICSSSILISWRAMLFTPPSSSSMACEGSARSIAISTGSAASRGSSPGVAGDEKSSAPAIARRRAGSPNLHLERRLLRGDRVDQSEPPEDREVAGVSRRQDRDLVDEHHRGEERVRQARPPQSMAMDQVEGERGRFFISS